MTDEVSVPTGPSPNAMLVYSPPTAPAPTGPSPNARMVSGEPMRPMPLGDYAADVVKSTGSGMAQGAAGMIGTPRVVGDVMSSGTDWASSKLGVPDNLRDQFKQGFMSNMPYPLSEMKRLGTSGPSPADVSQSMSELTGGATDYQPKTGTGQVLSKAGQLAPWAALSWLTGGLTAPEALLYGTAAPTAGSIAGKQVGETAADYFSPENKENWGKWGEFGGELMSPALSAKTLGRLGSAPMTADGARRAAEIAEIEKFTGSKLTSGAYRPADGPRAAALESEMRNPKLAARLSSQDVDFTRGTLKSLGIDAADATSDTMQKSVRDALEAKGKEIGDFYKGVPFSSDYGIQRVVDKVSKEFPKIMKQNSSISFGEKIKNVRADLNDIIVKGGKTEQSVAKDLKESLDKEFERALASNGADIQELKDLNSMYSRLSVVENAFDKSGLITPGSLYQSVAKSVGSNPKIAELGEISEKAKRYLISQGIKPTPKSMRGVIMSMLTGAGAAAGAASQLTANALMYGSTGLAAATGLAGLAGAVAPQIIRGSYNLAKNSGPVTAALQSIAKSKAVSGTGVPPGALSPSIMSRMTLPENPREGRKSGGRVSSHDAAADQLVRAAEHAKKGWSAETAPLLNHSDETVVKALEVANRSI